MDNCIRFLFTEEHLEYRRADHCYSKGMTVMDIQDHLSRLYGVDVSPTMISNVTNKLIPMIMEYKTGCLKASMQSSFWTSIHYKVRQEGVIEN